VSAISSAPSNVAQITGGQAVVDALIQSGVTAAFGIPSIHNIGIYDALRQRPEFHHWIVRHEQAAGFAADGFYRRSGKPAAVFASTGPGNLFTLVPLLESLQTGTPVILIGANVATPLLDKNCGALHETPSQLEILRPLTRFAVRVASAEEIPEAIAQAVAADGPSFVEIPNDLLYAPISSELVSISSHRSQPARVTATREQIAGAVSRIQASAKPIILLGSDVAKDNALPAVLKLAEELSAPVVTTTSGKGLIPDDHPLAMGCISRLGAVQDLLKESDLLISFGAQLNEFDTGRFGLKLPEHHIQAHRSGYGRATAFPASNPLYADLGAIAQSLLAGVKPSKPWCGIAAIRADEKTRLEALHQAGYEALGLLREAMSKDDVLANDQSILNYWASAFFPVLNPRSFVYPIGSGTLGYGLPAAIGAACAARCYGLPERVVCIAGDGGFQYTAHELATLAQYNLPVKILLVNDNAYGVIGFLQRSYFGHTHEVKLQNPDFCRMAESFGVKGLSVSSLEELQLSLRPWLDASGPALLEWRTDLKTPWETGAVNRPTSIPQPSQQPKESK